MLSMGEVAIMAFIITNACIKDELCVDVCPTDCIHPKKDEPAFAEEQQLFVDPQECIDCGACVPVCTSDAIHRVEDVPQELREYVALNAAYYVR